MTDVLISGAGVAGPTLAFWLARQGFRATVIEHCDKPRSSGNPVDVRGPAVPVVEAMGVMPRIREAATGVTSMAFVDAAGKTRARMRMPSAAGRGPEVEVPRSDLAAILHDAARADAEFVFDDTIRTLTQDQEGVDVTFARSAPRRFDLVIGADGLHSTVRRLAFGPESAYLHHAGLYVATTPLGRPADRRDEVVIHNTPGRLAAVHPAGGEAVAAFIYRSPQIRDLDHRDEARHRQLVAEAFDGAGWLVPELIERVHETTDLYFDAVSKVIIPTWSAGRIGLVGDAASCVSLLGDGSSLAIAGARTLATSLAAHDDHTAALRAYEQTHRRLVEPKQRNIGLAAAMLVPKSRPALAARTILAKVMR